MFLTDRRFNQPHSAGLMLGHGVGRHYSPWNEKSGFNCKRTIHDSGTTALDAQSVCEGLSRPWRVCQALPEHPAGHDFIAFDQKYEKRLTLPQTAGSFNIEFNPKRSALLSKTNVQEAKMKPTFMPGENIAIKVPAHQFEKTVSFYKDILGLEQTHLESPDQFESVTFKFGDKNLWIDKIASLSQAEIWLEIKTDNLAQASHYFEENSVVRRDEIEPLPSDFRGFWISSPSNIIHLVTK